MRPASRPHTGQAAALGKCHRSSPTEAAVHAPVPYRMPPRLMEKASAEATYDWKALAAPKSKEAEEAWGASCRSMRVCGRVEWVGGVGGWAGLKVGAEGVLRLHLLLGMQQRELQADATTHRGGTEAQLMCRATMWASFQRTAVQLIQTGTRLKPRAPAGPPCAPHPCARQRAASPSPPSSPRVPPRAQSRRAGRPAQSGNSKQAEWITAAIAPVLHCTRAAGRCCAERALLWRYPPTHHVAVLHAQLCQAGAICLQVVDAAGVLGRELQQAKGVPGRLS